MSDGMDSGDSELEALDARLQAAWVEPGDEPALARVRARLRTHMALNPMPARQPWTPWMPTFLGLGAVAVSAAILLTTIAIRQGILLPPPGPATSPPPLVAGSAPVNPAGLPPCAGSQLSLSLAAQARGGSVVIGAGAANAGATCHLRAQLTLTVADAEQRPLAVTHNPDASIVESDLPPAPTGVGPIPLASYAWSNWCGASGPFTLIATTGGAETSASQSATPRCDNRGAPSQLVLLETPSVTVMPATLAVRTVRSFFDAINAKDYANAYDAYAPALQSRQPYPQFVQGFTTTTSDMIVKIAASGLRGDGAVNVSIDFIAHRTTDSSEYLGTYVVAYVDGEPRIVAAQNTEVRHMSTP